MGSRVKVNNIDIYGDNRQCNTDGGKNKQLLKIASL
jgi:hypothetical protein